MSGGTITADFAMLTAQLLEILRAHEGMRVFSPRSEDGKVQEHVMLPKASLKLLDAAEDSEMTYFFYAFLFGIGV